MSTTAAKTNETVKSRMSTRDIVLIGMFAALLAAFSQISLPMPTGVPCSPPSFTYCWEPLGFRCSPISRAG